MPRPVLGPGRGALPTTRDAAGRWRGALQAWAAARAKAPSRAAPQTHAAAVVFQSFVLLGGAAAQLRPSGCPQLCPPPC